MRTIGRLEAPELNTGGHIGELGSLWIASAERQRRPALERDVHVDVAVLGAGIVGLTTALLAARDGAGVAVLEARQVGAGATGYTTAKLSSLHGLTYTQLASSHGDELARLYGEANEAGITLIAGLVEQLGLDCDLRRKPNYTYTESPDERELIEEEVDTASRLGLPASYVEQTDLPYPVAAAVRFDHQAEFHPVRYLEGLADAAAAAGVAVHEHTPAVGVDGGRVETARGRTVHAEQVVVATHMPFLDSGLHFARCHPERSYVVAARLPEVPQGMYLSTEAPAHSIRAHDLDGESWLLVGGESHKTGQGDALERYRRLAAWADERFGMSPELRWATQDLLPADGIPYVGRIDPLSRRVWVATGFRKWGLAMGTAAAELIAAGIAGRDHRFERLFDSNRLRVRASATTLLKENGNVALRFFGDRVLKRGGVEEIAPGQGRIVGSGLGQRAVYRDDDGGLHVLSARCTHLGCIVNWNSGEGTWDCPCHGSRFDARGGVIEGPAVRGLPPAREG